MIDVTFTVPIVPIGAPRPRARVIAQPGKKPRPQIYMPAVSRDYKRTIALAAQPHMPDAVIDEPLRVDLLALMPRPKRLLRRKDPDGLIWDTSKPDRDNLDKAVLDALSPYWRDDTLVCLGTLLKAYHARDGRPGLHVRIRSAALFDPQHVAQQLGLLPLARAAASDAEAS